MGLLILVIILLMLLLGVGQFGYPSYGYASFSPLFGLVVVILILWVLGVLR